VDVKVRKPHNLFLACRRACGARWGLGPKVVHWLYVSIIRPSISFASLVKWVGSQMSSATERLSRVQRLVCLGIRGEIHTIPTGAMEALTGMPLLDLVIQVKARSAVHHIWSLGCWS